MRHYRDACLNDPLDRRCRVDAAFELDRVRTSLGQEAARVAKRLLEAQLPAEKGHVSYDVRALRAARHRSTVVDDLVDGHRKGGVQPLDHHSKRVAHQQDVESRIVEQAREGGIVCGHHGDPGAVPLHVAKPGHRHGPLVGGVCSGHRFASLWSRPGRFPVHAATPDKDSTDFDCVIGSKRVVKSND
jgi:hypothetical protein